MLEKHQGCSWRLKREEEQPGKSECCRTWQVMVKKFYFILRLSRHRDLSREITLPDLGFCSDYLGCSEKDGFMGERMKAMRLTSNW